jgi:hypothetical protein
MIRLVNLPTPYYLRDNSCIKPLHLYAVIYSGNEARFQTLEQIVVFPMAGCARGGTA